MTNCTCVLVQFVLSFFMFFFLLQFFTPDDNETPIIDTATTISKVDLEQSDEKIVSELNNKSDKVQIEIIENADDLNRNQEEIVFKNITGTITKNL